MFNKNKYSPEVLKWTDAIPVIGLSNYIIRNAEIYHSNDEFNPNPKYFFPNSILLATYSGVTFMRLPDLIKFSQDTLEKII